MYIAFTTCIVCNICTFCCVSIVYIVRNVCIVCFVDIVCIVCIVCIVYTVCCLHCVYFLHCNTDMLWEMSLDNKLKNKSHDENHSPFTFSFHHINTTLPLHH